MRMRLRTFDTVSRDRIQRQLDGLQFDEFYSDAQLLQPGRDAHDENTVRAYSVSVTMAGDVPGTLMRMLRRDSQSDFVPSPATPSRRAAGRASSPLGQHCRQYCRCCFGERCLLHFCLAGPVGFGCIAGSPGGDAVVSRGGPALSPELGISADSSTWRSTGRRRLLRPWRNRMFACCTSAVAAASGLRTSFAGQILQIFPRRRRLRGPHLLPIVSAHAHSSSP